MPHFVELAGDKRVHSDSAASVLDSLKVLVRACKSAPPLFRKVETTLLGLVAELLSPEARVYAEDGLEIFSLLLHYTPSLTSTYWEALPVLASIVLAKDEKGAWVPGWGFELFPQMLYALQNYVAR